MGLQEYKEMWRFHLRPWTGISPFPRDMSSRETLTTIINGVERPTPLNRSTLISEEQYLQSLSGAYKKKDCYVAVFSDWQISHKIFDTIFIELADAHPQEGKYYNSIEEAMSEIMFGKYLVEKKLNKLGIAYRSMFTAGRGFHYYLDFEPVFMKDYKSTVIDFLSKLDLLDLVDVSVLECARISRIPYTKHLKTGNFAIYDKANMEVKDLLAASKENKILIEPVKELKKTNILDYLNLDLEPPKIVSTIDPYSRGYEGWYPECVIAIMEKLLVNQHATHAERRHLCGYLKRFNLSDSEIVEYFKNASDFNRDIAMAQIESLKDYSNISCRNVRLEFKDLCPGICEYIREVARRRTP